MKILHVIPSIAPRYGGPSMAISQMCAALRAAGVETLIATTDADGPGRLEVPLGTETTYAGEASIFFPKQATEALKYSRPLSRWLRRNVRRFDAVHIHAVFSHAPVAAAAAARQFQIPYVVRPLGTIEPWSMAQKPLRKQILWRLACRRMMRGAAAIHYTTAEERKLAEQSLGLERGVVIPLGITPELGAAGSGAEAALQFGGNYVLVVCRLHPKKNLEMLIRVFGKMRPESAPIRMPSPGPPDLQAHPLREGEGLPWKLIIAGEGEPEYRMRLEALVKELGLGDRVVFSGWMEGAAKARAIQGASLFALISHQENLGISVIEALGCGVPALISDRMNLAEEVRVHRAGWVVPLQDHAVQQALDEALGNPEERRRRGAAGRALVAQRYTWPTVARQLVDLYRSIKRP